MDEKWDGQIAPVPGQAIEDDRFYYRSDKEDIDHIVLKGAFVCRVYLGLRRFGKSSFLKRIERLCNGVNGGFDSEKPEYGSVRAYFVPIMGSPEDAAQGIEAALQDDAQNAETKIVLLDDIQGYSTWFESQLDELASFEIALKQLFRTAAESQGRVRIVLAEPTNHREWLEPPERKAGLGGAQGAGPQFLRLCGQPILNCSSYMSALTINQSTALLTGSPLHTQGATERRLDLDNSQVTKLHTAFGGNPWFLSVAHRLLAERGDLSVLNDAARLQTFFSDVNRSLGADGLTSIYKSLSRQEKLIVDLLHDRWFTRRTGELYDKARQEGRESLTLFPDDGRPGPWEPDAQSIYLPRLKQMGLISGSERGDMWLTSDIFTECVNSLHNRVPILDRLDEIELDVWNELIGGRTPWERRSSRCVIHQFSDLLFEDGETGHEYWQAYIDWVRTLSEEQSDNWPHFVVLCGNLLPGAVGEQRDRDDDEVIEEGYRTRLRQAFERLMEVVPYLRPVKDAKPSGEQVIILPGVLDISWPDTAKWSGDDPQDLAAKLQRFYMRRKQWNDVIGDFPFSGGSELMEDEETGEYYTRPKPLPFRQQRIVFVPFDTVALEGVQDELGPRAVDDLSDVRNRIRTTFAKEWAGLRDPQRREKAGGRGTGKGNRDNTSLEQWRRFLDFTWRYSLCDESGRRDARSTFRSPFRWEEFIPAGGKRHAERPVTREWISDAGFVTEVARDHLDELVKADGETPMLKMAITHHAPRQVRRSTTVQFSQSYRFRQALARAAVHWVLHGHSQRQQRTHEVVSAKKKSTTINLLSPGTFSTLPDDIPEHCMMELDEVPRRPSFNQITVTPPDRIDPRRQDFDVQVSFWEWPKGAREPSESR